jgi:hypothetical protein
MRRAVLMTLQAISPRFAIKIRLNMDLFACNLEGGIRASQSGTWRRM